MFKIMMILMVTTVLLTSMVSAEATSLVFKYDMATNFNEGLPAINMMVFMILVKGSLR